MSEDVLDVEGDVGGRFQHLHLHLHVTQDAEVATDQRLKFNQVVQWFESSRQAYIIHVFIVGLHSRSDDWWCRRLLGGRSYSGTSAIWSLGEVVAVALSG